jgi:hypothetical protein
VIRVDDRGKRANCLAGIKNDRIDRRVSDDMQKLSKVLVRLWVEGSIPLVRKSTQIKSRQNTSMYNLQCRIPSIDYHPYLWFGSMG